MVKGGQIRSWAREALARFPGQLIGAGPEEGMFWAEKATCIRHMAYFRK